MLKTSPFLGLFVYKSSTHAPHDRLTLPEDRSDAHSTGDDQQTHRSNEQENPDTTRLEKLLGDGFVPEKSPKGDA